MRIVVDTNVFVSGIFWGGTPQNVLLLWRDGLVDLVVSGAIVEELKDVLLKVVRELSAEREIAEAWVAFVKRYAVYVEPAEQVDVCRDPKDNKFLEAAAAGNVHYIVSGDNDLLIVKQFCRSEICTPATLLAKLES